jgi:hypothetical protein
VAIIAAGDEVIAPREGLGEGKLYASNLVTLVAWCSLYGMETTVLGECVQGQIDWTQFIPGRFQTRDDNVPQFDLEDRVT